MSSYMTFTLFYNEISHCYLIFILYLEPIFIDSPLKPWFLFWDPYFDLFLGHPNFAIQISKESLQGLGIFKFLSAWECLFSYTWKITHLMSLDHFFFCSEHDRRCFILFWHWMKWRSLRWHFMWSVFFCLDMSNDSFFF